MKAKDGGAAFPKHTQSLARSDAFESWVETLPGSDGMTLRDYFAAKAMPVVYADNCALKVYDAAECAIEAYRIADAMLAEREKGAK